MEDFETIPNKKAKCVARYSKMNKTTNCIVEGITVCKHCNSDVKYSGETTNLRTHLTIYRPTLKTKVKLEKTDNDSEMQTTHSGKCTIF